MNNITASGNTASGNTGVRTTFARRLLCAVLVAGAGYCALDFLFLVLANFWPGPYIDYWIDLPKIQAWFDNTLTLHELVNAHANVHRLLVPRLLFIADYRFFAGNNVLLVAVVIACKLASFALLYQLVRRESVLLRATLGSLIAIAVFNAGNVSNVIHNSNLQWDVMTLLSMLAVFAFAQAQDASPPLRGRYLLLAWCSFALAFFSQAGSLPVLPVFAVIALLHRRYLSAALHLGFALLVFYITFRVLPVQEPQKPTFEPAVAMAIFKPGAMAAYVFRFLSAPLPHYLGTAGLYFSAWLLVLFAGSLLFARRTTHIAHNIFLHLALFLFLMMVIIAGARVDFSPNTWWATRYQVTTLLFMLCVTVHVLLAVRPPALRCLVAAHGFAMLLMTHYFTHNVGFDLSDRVFSAQAFMLTEGADQHHGANLLPSIQPVDRIADADPFLREHGFAWYHNKQGHAQPWQSSKQPGEQLLAPGQQANFASTCLYSANAPAFTFNTELQDYELSVPLSAGQRPLSALLHRNTWYVLDDAGVVQGFAYVMLEPVRFGVNAYLHGYTRMPVGKYLADIHHDAPRCLYALNSGSLQFP